MRASRAHDLGSNPRRSIAISQFEVETDLTKSHGGYTVLIAETGSEILMIEIEHRSSKEQIEKNIRKNLENSDVVYEIASDKTAKKKAIQVALNVMFRL